MGQENSELLQQEEHPPIISNIGMGSVLVNYYRKKDEKDETVPKVFPLPSKPLVSAYTLPVGPWSPIRLGASR